MQTAYSGRRSPKPAKRTSTTTADVRDRLATLGAPQMPESLAAKVADAIATESARRGFVTDSTRPELVTSR